MVSEDLDTDQLLQRADHGDADARQQLLMRHRQRLRQMIALRMDRRLAARLDPSDVVQETLAEAVQQLSDYLRRRPLPFYPWLRQLALDRLAELHRRHIQAHKRSVTREQARAPRTRRNATQPRRTWPTTCGGIWRTSRLRPGGRQYGSGLPSGPGGTRL